MTRLTAARALALVAGCLSVNAADSLFKDPIISVSPHVMNFGSVPVNTSVTNSFLVENWGGGKLVGMASVSKPFKILSGGTYRLGAADAQVVTISYTPIAAGKDTNFVQFTGGAGALVPVKGKGIAKSR